MCQCPCLCVLLFVSLGVTFQLDNVNVCMCGIFQFEQIARDDPMQLSLDDFNVVTERGTLLNEERFERLCVYLRVRACARERMCKSIMRVYCIFLLFRELTPAKFEVMMLNQVRGYSHRKVVAAMTKTVEVNFKHYS